MTKSRLKKLAAQVPQNDAELSRLLTATQTAQTSMEKLIAERDESLTKARQALEDKHGWDRAIAGHEADIARNLELLETWSVINAKRFGDAKSLVMFGCRFGYRLGNWKTKATEKWDKVVEKLQKWLEAGKAEDAQEDIKERAAIAADYLVFSCDPDKKAMLRDRDVKARRALLEKAGVAFEQDESFYLEPDREGQAPARLEAA